MLVAGARPNFVKLAPLVAELGKHPDLFDCLVVHTGQHYGASMSEVFFRELDIPEPDVNLGAGSGTHVEQTAGIMLSLEPVIKRWAPDWVVVLGDVNSTLAAAVTAVKASVRVAHVEAGLRSFDRTMPEEHNRVLTDHLSDVLFTPSRDASANLRREGIQDERIYFVGNVMIDTLVRLLPKTDRRELLAHLGLLDHIGRPLPYVLVTLHRPSNVDNGRRLRDLVAALEFISREHPVVFPIHPRTRKSLNGLCREGNGLQLTEPMGYLDFLTLERHAGVVVTDSGGVQEETTYLGVPCLTVRANTERPITVFEGTNRVIGTDPELLVTSVIQTLNAEKHTHHRHPPELWDGRASERIVCILGHASEAAARLNKSVAVV